MMMNGEIEPIKNEFEEVIDRNIELTVELKDKLREFTGYLRGITIGMTVIILVQFAMLLWILLR